LWVFKFETIIRGNAIPKGEPVDDIMLRDALLLWNAGLNARKAAFAVRPLGDPDAQMYEYQNGACMDEWRAFADLPEPALLAKAMVELWHIVAFSNVPAAMVHAEMIRVPEYRNMLADDCLPSAFRHERGTAV